MKNFVIVAEQDRGKTYFIKNEILKKFHFDNIGPRENNIFDVNLEYVEFKNRIKGLPSKDQFLNSISLNTHPPARQNNIFEESTAFFSRAGVSEGEIMTHIYRRFHTKNINVFVFHALKFVPLDILLSIDFFVIFRTPDSLFEVEKRFSNFPKIIEAFKDVKQKTEGTRFDRERKTYPDQRSKDFFHYRKIVTR